MVGVCAVAQAQDFRDPVEQWISPGDKRQWKVPLEGYWDAVSDHGKAGAIMPIPGKGFDTDWLEKVLKFEKLLVHKFENRELGDFSDLAKEEDVGGHKLMYTTMRGMSPCRVEGCEEQVGSAEFRLDGFRWPRGYVEHYLKNHKCLPTKRFYDKMNQAMEDIMSESPGKQSSELPEPTDNVNETQPEHEAGPAPARNSVRKPNFMSWIFSWMHTVCWVGLLLLAVANAYMWFGKVDSIPLYN